jgi:hypothetical protein
VKKLAPITIKGYRSAIARVYRIVGLYDPGADQDLSLLLENFSLERPRQRQLFPKWSLSLVLNFLSSDIFEPLEQAALDRLTVKTVFLVTLATAARVSEIHALSALPDCLRFNEDGSVSLMTCPGFIAKNRLPEAGNQSFRLTPLEHDVNFCPVRALRIYCHRTDNVRSVSDPLFLSWTKSKKTSPQCVSRWITNLIREAYRAAERGRTETVEETSPSSSVCPHRGAGSPHKGLDKDTTAIADTHPGDADVPSALGLSPAACDYTNANGACSQNSAEHLSPTMGNSDAVNLTRPAHELRAVASSLAFRRGAALNDVIQAVGWTSASTFGRFYLRHMGGSSGLDQETLRLPARR